MDSQGRMVDQTGTVINLKQSKELKINESKLKDQGAKDLERIMKFAKVASGSDILTKRKFFDNTIADHNTKNKRDRKMN